MFTESQVHRVVDRSSMELPIKKLSDDLLLEIFSVNASNKLTEDFHSITPVTTTRFSSQVCKHWRHLILGSSSLWGGLLNLDDLIRASNKWRKEVLSRTKTAMLTVRIGCNPESRRVTSFLLKILDEEWSRIQHLEVLPKHMNWHVKYNYSWLPILRPTENLRSFSLHFPVEATPEPLRYRTDLNVLFSGQAPSLRAVSIRHMHFPLPALWLSQLSELCLEGQFSLDIIMESLTAMPFLEVLEISNWHDAGFPYPQRPKIILPRLKCLITRGPLGACLLDHIIAPPECGLDFGSPLFVADQDLSADLQVLSRYCDGHLKTYNPTIKLLLDSTTFGFHTPREPKIPPFDIRIENILACPRSSAHSLIAPFLESPASCFLPATASHSCLLIPISPSSSPCCHPYAIWGRIRKVFVISARSPPKAALPSFHPFSPCIWLPFIRNRWHK